MWALAPVALLCAESRFATDRQGSNDGDNYLGEMTKPARPSDPVKATGRPRTFFLTTSTASGRHILQTERMANLLIDVLRNCMHARRFVVHDFVVMPDHVHILVTLPGDLGVEKAMQFIKGGFSYRAKKELNFQGEIWQRGYSDVRVMDVHSLRNHREYIELNPVKAGLASSAEEFPFGSAYLKLRKRTQVETERGLKAGRG